MKNIIESHTHNIYLKPGEVVVARKPVLISTILGSCVAVTMFAPGRGFGAICHAMLPDSGGRSDDLRYVDTALRHIHRKAVEYGVEKNLVIKIFGGSSMLNIDNSEASTLTIGDQNVARAFEVIASLGLEISGSDTGGPVGRKLYFCTRDGDIYLRRMRNVK